MCERCEKSIKNLNERREFIDRMVEKAEALMSGNYPEDVQKLIAKEPFPKNKPFAEMLYRYGSAIQVLAMAFGAITDEPPSIVLGEMAGVALESEIESGHVGGLALLLQKRGEADQEIFRMMGDDDLPLN